MSRIQVFQAFIGVVVSITTTLIGWQTFQLSQRAAETNGQLEKIEQQFEQTKFGFERIRDVYDRTESYLSSENQNKARGRVLVVLINSMPDTSLRGELLNVVINNAELDSVAAAAADVESPKLNWDSELERNSKFNGDFSLDVDEDTFQVTTKGDFTFTDSKGFNWIVPKGVTLKVSSIPRIFWAQFGSPLEGGYTIPLLLHGYYASVRSRSHQDVNAMFYESLVESGYSKIKAQVLYAAIAAHGPRWSVQE